MYKSKAISFQSSDLEHREERGVEQNTSSDPRGKLTIVDYCYVEFNKGLMSFINGDCFYLRSRFGSCCYSTECLCKRWRCLNGLRSPLLLIIFILLLLHLLTKTMTFNEPALECFFLCHFEQLLCLKHCLFKASRPLIYYSKVA